MMGKRLHNWDNDPSALRAYVALFGTTNAPTPHVLLCIRLAAGMDANGNRTHIDYQLCERLERSFLRWANKRARAEVAAAIGPPVAYLPAEAEGESNDDA